MPVLPPAVRRVNQGSGKNNAKKGHAKVEENQGGEGACQAGEDTEGGEGLGQAGGVGHGERGVEGAGEGSQDGHEEHQE
eukprot:15462720-Alexandrium_andersonii.AAC.1